MKRYDITTADDTMNVERYLWLKHTLKESQFRVINDGFLIDCYYVQFMDPTAETAYLLRWS